MIFAIPRQYMIGVEENKGSRNFTKARPVSFQSPLTNSPRIRVFSAPRSFHDMLFGLCADRSLRMRRAAAGKGNSAEGLAE